MNRTALIAVDVQPDFRPGGPLAVPDGDAVVAPILASAREADVVVATQDFHPADHCSFVEQGGIWPAHCVAGTPGAEIDPDILAVADIVIQKATTQATDAYSGFQGTDLAEQLRALDVTKVRVAGLATDYCVRATALDALDAGFEVEVLADAVRGVNVQPGDADRALDELAQAGAVIVAGPAPAGV